MNEKTSKPKVKVFAVVGFLILIALVWAYFKFSAHSRSTENAYIGADVVEISAQVGGRVVLIKVNNNQLVKSGDVLFELDVAPFQIALTRAEANLAAALQTARQDNAEVDVARAQIAQNEAELNNARSQYTRTKNLIEQHFASQQAAEDALSKVTSLQASLQQARAKLEKAQAAPSKLEERADVLRARAEIAQAKLDLAHTKIIAERDGLISNLSLTEGNLVRPATPLFALIEQNSFHVDANFKETELPGIHPGQVVDIEVDMYPGQIFHGKVDSLSGGTGTAFSLLPPQNATGNWVKIAQRVPVKISFDKIAAERPLRIGATATVTVHLD
jgi:membrane fusion protein (multidrug efflux system)